MFATSLPSLPPPATSLLPILNEHRNPEFANTSDGLNSLQAQQQQQQQRRARPLPHNMQVRNPLAMLAYEERTLEQRKSAIQTYGYSWLKPAGCNKTMLGRREEEIEREEVERQLREVELQERNAAEIEEAERMAQQQQQRAQEDRGEVITGEEGDRDLDEELPDMDAQAEYDDEDEEDEDEDEEGDLDDEIPEGDSGFAYDTTRDPDTESEETDFGSTTRSQNAHRRAPLPRWPIRSGLENREDPEQEDFSPQVLGQDEVSAHEDDLDLDDDVPDMDAEDRDLDDEVPDAGEDDDDGGWEHTDTELEESDMDISIMPVGAVVQDSSMLPPSSDVGQRQRQLFSRQNITSQQSDSGTGLRRTSGNVPLPMAPPTSSASQMASRRGLGRPRQAAPHFTPAQLDSDISVSALISTGNTGVTSVGGNPSGSSQRAWLDPASARRNLFGANRHVSAQSSDNVRGTAALIQPPQTLSAIPNLIRTQSGSNQTNEGTTRQVSSGGLFTPSPQPQRTSQDGRRVVEEPRSRTRSGRLHGLTGRNSRAS